MMNRTLRLSYIANFMAKGYSTSYATEKELREKIRRLKQLEKTNIEITEVLIDGVSYPPEEFLLK